MKKIGLLFLVLCFYVIGVKAEELPVVIEHKVMVTNKEGTICYKEGKKTDMVIPYKTMLMVSYDISGNYVNVYNNDYNCDVVFSDVSSNSQKFDINNNEVNDINPIRAIIMSKTGLNLRVGPSVTYSKVVTIPQNTIVTLTHKAGTYWYYTEYNGNFGWVTAMNKYLGFDYDRVLINYDKTSIYDVSGTKVVGTIPASTEITDYVKLDTQGDNELKYYVVYNGVKGYIKDMLFKTDVNGEIKLVKDVEIKDDKGNALKRMTTGSVLEYTMVKENNFFYFPDKKLLITLKEDEFEYTKKTNPMVKKTGYIGEGKFGEEIKEREFVTSTPEPKEENNNSDKGNIKDIIIICLLAAIFITLVVLIIMKILANKKNKGSQFKNIKLR